MSEELREWLGGDAASGPRLEVLKAPEPDKPSPPCGFHRYREARMSATSLVQEVMDRSDGPFLLDLFCCAGGAGMGYHQAGFTVVGVDIEPQPRYPFAFIQASVQELPQGFIRQFDAVHASPPCQAYSKAQRLQNRDHPDLIPLTRLILQDEEVPYVIENVPGAPLWEPALLCGSMFPELRVYRHRLFETSFDYIPPHHSEHTHPQGKMGRPVKDGEFIQVVGNFSGVAYARKAMGIDWMTRDELREALPPAFTKHIGEQLIALLEYERLAA